MTPIGKTLGGAALFAALAGGAAGAQDATGAEMFARLDGNGDGGISAQELTDFRNRMFDTLDGNGDGRMTATEIAMLQSRAAEAGLGDGGSTDPDRLMRRDANGDGVLTRAEFTAETRAFAIIDRDKNGKITQAELEAVRARLEGAL